MRPRLPAIALALLALALLAGCGDDDFGEVTVEPTPGQETTTPGEGTEPAPEEEATEAAPPREGAAPDASEDDLRPEVQTCRSELVAKGVILAVNVGCAETRTVVTGWMEGDACAPTAAGRSSCTVEGFRCLGTSAEQGTSVSCTRGRRSIGFLARPR